MTLDPLFLFDINIYYLFIYLLLKSKDEKK